MSQVPASQHKVTQPTPIFCREDPDWTPPDQSARLPQSSPSFVIYGTQVSMSSS